MSKPPGRRPAEPVHNPPSDGAGVERKKPEGGYPEGEPGSKPPQQPDPGSPHPKTTPTKQGN